MNHKHKKGWIFLLVCPPLILLAVTWIVMSLWNCLLPEILGVKSITFWQAMGILILSKILFGGFHFGKGMKDFKERKMREKMEGLSPEEKKSLKKPGGTDVQEDSSAEITNNLNFKEVVK